MGFYDILTRLRGGYRDALISQGNRDAFDRFVKAWSDELVAISHAESLS
jgi:hypothetical protein